MIQIPPPGHQRPGRATTLLDDPHGGLIRRSVVASGVRVMTEAMPSTRSVTVGVWVPVGSRDEPGRYAGASHFLEHLLFKGTPRRSALDISASIDAVGGELNAFTTKEYTCYYARVLDRDAALAVDVLLDMVLCSTVATADVESERSVVREEIAMHDDDPAGVAHELFTAQVFAGSRLAAPVIGSDASIAGMPPADVRRWYRRWYRPETIAVVAAGGLDHAAVVRDVKRAVRRADLRVEAGTPRPGRRSAERVRHRPAPASRISHQRDTEQSNVVVGMPGIGRSDPRRYALGVLNAALGGGMSSRLFQEVREKRGLAYSVQSFSSMYSDSGAFGVYAGSRPERVDETLAVIGEVLGDVRRDGLDAIEVERGKGQLRGGLVLSLEESSSRMVTLGEAEVVTGRIVPISEALAAIDAITAEDVQEVATEVLAGPQHVSLVGPVADIVGG